MRGAAGASSYTLPDVSGFRRYLIFLEHATPCLGCFYSTNCKNSLHGIYLFIRCVLFLLLNLMLRKSSERNRTLVWTIARLPLLFTGATSLRAAVGTGHFIDALHWNRLSNHRRPSLGQPGDPVSHFNDITWSSSFGLSSFTISIIPVRCTFCTTQVLLSACSRSMVLLTNTWLYPSLLNRVEA